MKKIGYIILMLVTLSGFSGCATAQLAKGPDIHSLKQYAGTPQVAIAVVEDARGSTGAGSIGATSINVPTNVTEMVYNYLVDCLNKNFEINVKEAGGNAGTERTIVSKISSIKISSFDAIMQPVNTEIVLDLSVLDKSGQPIYKQTYIGKYEERIGISIVDSKTGKLVESAVQKLALEIANDSSLKKILTQ